LVFAYIPTPSGIFLWMYSRNVLAVLPVKYCTHMCWMYVLAS
jgi:hypothetical protein